MRRARMSNLSIITVGGNLARDPDQKELESGRTVVEFTVANTRYNKRAQEEYTTWYRVTVWQEYLQARILARLKKGTGVTVCGEYNPVPKGDGTGAVWHNIEQPSVEFGARQRDRSIQTHMPAAQQDDTSQHTTTIDNDDDIPF
jgi:single-stranded DNA-binding protein